MEGESPEDISNKARGYKANLSNPSAQHTYPFPPPPLPPPLSFLIPILDTSEESKAHSREVLDDLPDNPLGAAGGEQKDPKNVARGLKAATNNPGLSEESKAEAQRKLDALGG